MNAPGEALAGLSAGEAPVEIEAIFSAQYERIARVVARVIRDHGRAEELAVEVFLKLLRHRRVQGAKVEAWLFRVAVRAASNELRAQNRRARYERLLGFAREMPTPEDIRAATEAQERVRLVLGVIERRQAELLLLRSHGLSYEELASALEINPASIGTLLSRAQQTFRKEYIRRYGEA